MEKFGHRLFDMYKTIHDHARGRGLGLYLIKMQVELLGGSIKVESKLGQGTPFIVLLPQKGY